jgi:hypothetical protein
MKPPPNTIAAAANQPAPDTIAVEIRSRRPSWGDMPMTCRNGAAVPAGAGTSGTSRSRLVDLEAIAR